MSLNFMVLINMKMTTYIEYKFKMVAERDNMDMYIVITNHGTFPKSQRFVCLIEEYIYIL